MRKNARAVTNPSNLYCTMLGLLILFFALYLAAALLDKTRPRNAERHLTMIGFALLVPVILTQPLPAMVLPLLSLFFAAFLQKAR